MLQGSSIGGAHTLVKCRWTTHVSSHGYRHLEEIGEGEGEQLGGLFNNIRSKRKLSK